MRDEREVGLRTVCYAAATPLTWRAPDGSWITTSKRTEWVRQGDATALPPGLPSLPSAQAIDC
jgi:hypothetical protein